ncbi:uncharacterized protein LOC121423188 isoform X2 [Lytechinus variegatus]|uniref:uncharacterized protein LOC121423188 isoform X2 n=1 Tax=Lytechinus variegatus TaxID=7654 RepID=UPI001BB1B1B6|nr:uncharacterized protein LOC121423188 isoform X2 [Lytechinus variegatus]
MESKTKGKKKKTSGDRCMVMNCGSTYQSATVHSMPGPLPAAGGRFSALQMAWIHFIKLHRVFDHTRVKHIHVCSLHFDKSQYDPTQLQMYEMGLRKNPPKLLPDAVPHIYEPAASTSTTTLSEPLATHSSSESHSSSQTTSSTSNMSKSSASEAVGVAAAAARPSTQGRILLASDSASKPQVKRQRTSYFRKKKFHRRVGIRIWRRSCKVQVKPITISRGKQVNLPRLMAEVCDAVTQTEEIVVLPPPVNPDEGPASELDEPEPEDEPEEDDESKDPTYIPSEETNSPCKERPPALSQPKSPLEEQKFIVFETNLLELFQVCLSCLSRNMNVEKVCPHTYGSAMKVVATCLDCGHRRDWQSQPKVGDVMAGNFILAAAILFGGGSPTKFLRILKHMNLKAITVETFMKHQRETLQPAIIRVAKEEQRKVIQEIPEGEGLVLGGDGRADSPGHCAKYGAYTLMDLKRNKIVDVQLVQSNEVRNSNAMEKEGLRRGLAKLEELNVRVDTLVTDRHAQVAKWLRENYPEITHKYDVWHIAKGLLKKISAIAKLKDCEVLGRWKKSINNHVYWCASSTPDGDGDIIVAKFQSILNHIRNVHENHGELYPSCSHGEDYERREWMTQGSKAFDKLSQELSKTRLKNDMKKMSPLAQTSSVEAFHSVMLYWCPKMLAYSYAGIKCRLAIAALHWNENAGRSHATKADGTPMYKINYPKAKEGGHTVSRVLTNCTYNYVTLLMEETMKLVSEKQKIRSTIPELEGKPPLCSGVERPDKAEAVQRLNEHRRFIHQ